MSTYGLRPGDTDKCNKTRWHHLFKINRDSFDGKAKHRQQTQLNVFTDGSKIDEKTGAGIVVYEGKKETKADCFRLPDGTTVFQVEIAAISKAAELLLTKNIQELRFVKIFVDFQAAIKAIGNNFITSCVVATAVDNLNKLAERAKSVTIVWIPAHKGAPL